MPGMLTLSQNKLKKERERERGRKTGREGGSHAWWHMPKITAMRRLRQED
jgi:hypothetical protein